MPIVPVVPLAADGSNQQQHDDSVVANAASVTASAEAVTAQETFDKRNKKLYGVLVQSLPDWLRTSVYNTHRNDGLAAVTYLRRSFDSNDVMDHATQLSRLQASYIDTRNDISEDDLRYQYDAMMTAVAAIGRTGVPAPADATLMAMFDNSLPQSYSTIRQLVRRAGHGTFLTHYGDYMAQVRA